MKKRFAFILVLLAFMSSVFGYSGYFSDEKELKIVKTQWFDIIYPQECEQTAFILKENADSLFEELCAQFGTEPDFRMPVVITPDNQQFNAYWTSYPYNHIVVFDTALISDLTVFSQTMLSTFKHELTHAVTYNLKNPFFKVLGKVIGDAATVAPWLVTSGLAEGATVSLESANGEGRLNDEYAMQNVKQAKIQNKFPDYFDVQVSTDIYPYGQFYYFNGAFNAWLQENYGMEKYAKLWYTCVNMGALTVKSAFKKVYGVPLADLWQAFIRDFPVPDSLMPDPVSAGLAENIFKNKTINESGRVFSSVCGNQNGIVYLDETTDTVFFISWDSIFQSEEGAKPEKLFTKNNLFELSTSLDGRYIVYDYYDTGKANTKKSIGIYDLEKHTFFNTNLTGVEEGFIIKKEDSYYFGCKTFSSQKYGISLYSIEENEKNGKIQNLNHIWTQDFAYGVFPYSFTPVAQKDGTFAFICKNKMEFSVAVWNLDGNQLASYKMPEEGMVIRDLYPVIAENNEWTKTDLAFSFTNKGTLPRYGTLNLKNSTVKLQTQDISGGVYNPVIYLNQKDRKQGIIYAAHLYNQVKLLKLGAVCTFAEYKCRADENLTVLDAEEEQEQINFEINGSQKYGAFSSINKGLLIPLSLMTSRSYGSGAVSQEILLGLTYLTGNPWDSNTFSIMAGYSPSMNSGAMEVDYSSGTATSLFSWNTSGYLELDGFGFKQTYGTLDCSSAIPFGNISYFVFGASQFDYYGRGGDSKVKLDNYFYNSSALSAGFQSVYKAGPGRYEKAGFGLSSVLSYQYLQVFKNDGTGSNADYADLGFKAFAYIPHLIPIECNRNFVYNLPLQIKAGLFAGETSSAPLNYNNVYIGASSLREIYDLNAFNIQAELILFGGEIQKSIPFFSFFYFEEFKVSLFYLGGFGDDLYGTETSFHLLELPAYFKKLGSGEVEWENHLALNFELGMTPVVLNAGKINFSVKIIFL
ncbi:MAG: hypothetical protein MJ179_01420 [Treponema sp.]|nr:hypothetical protein [Treponema sp.]